MVYIRYVNNIPDWARKYKNRGLYIGNNYCAYSTRAKWVKKENRIKTLPPEYLGVVTLNGIVNKAEMTGISGDYEYGNVSLLYSLTSPIECAIQGFAN